MNSLNRMDELRKKPFSNPKYLSYVCEKRPIWWQQTYSETGELYNPDMQRVSYGS